jgi:hypothetical protein
MAFCTNCGEKLQDGAAFCTSCGSSVRAEASSENVKNEADRQPAAGDPDPGKQPEQVAAAPAVSGACAPEIMIKAASGLSIAAVVIIFFPWAQALWGLISISGFRAAFMFRDFGFVSFLCLAYFLMAGFAAVRGTIYFLGSSTGAKTRPAIVISMAAAFCVLLIIMFKVSADTHGFNIFTVWFYLEIIVTAAAAGAAFAYKVKS